MAYSHDVVAEDGLTDEEGRLAEWSCAVEGRGATLHMRVHGERFVQDVPYHAVSEHSPM